MSQRLWRTSALSETTLWQCPSLKVIDTRGAKFRVTALGNHAFRCVNLAEIDLSGLHNVVRIGDDFLRGCRLLTRVELRKLLLLASVGCSFLQDCTLLEEVWLPEPPPLTGVTPPLPQARLRIGADFLSGCESLRTILGSQVLPKNAAQISGFLRGTPLMLERFVVNRVQ
jgi:hypothetical protein